MAKRTDDGAVPLWDLAPGEVDPALAGVAADNEPFGSFAELVADGRIDAGWAAVLAPVAARIDTVGRFLDDETAAGRAYLPATRRVLRAFEAPMADIRVLIVGQDPYPTPGHPVGLSFAAERHVRPIPRSLQNIYRELRDDLGVQTPEHGDLSSWTEHGVLLLNRVLTVRPGDAGSHRRIGWEQITEHAIRALAASGQPLVAILWGKDAGTLTPLLGADRVIESVHPSPLSASRGFFGSRPFSRANAMLEAQGGEAIDWRIA